MTRSATLSFGLRTTAAALLLVACTSTAPAAGPGNAADDPQPQQHVVAANVSEQIADLAERGKFGELAHLIDTLPKTPESQSLTKSIDSYQAHLEIRRDAKQKAYIEALDKAMAHIDEGKLEEAMVKVIEAHSLAEHPDKLLQNERVAKLIQTVDAMAAKAQDEAHFVDSVSLYRLLDLLYEDTRLYHEQYLDAVTHIRVLQLYDPAELRDLYKQRAQRLGDEETLKLFEEADDQELEDWTIKLADIELTMMAQVFSQAATRHIDKEDYAVLVKGAAEGLSVMIQTDGIEDVFPGLKDKEKVAKLQEKLDAVSKDLDREGRRLTRTAAMTTLVEMMEVNRQTVNLPENVIVYELTTGATNELDQFSAVIWPEELKQFSRSISGNFVGVGVQIQKTDGKLTVVTPLEGTPAMKAGLKANDVIAKVNGVSSAAWSIDRAVREITGPENTKVTLTIIREGVEEPFDVTVTRKQIDLESIKGFAHREEGGWDYWIDKEAGIGYIRMNQFLRQTAEDMDLAVAQMQKQGKLNAIVLDLRFNPGGLLSTAIGVVDRFVDAGRIVATVNAEGIATSSFDASRRNTYDADIDLVVLINQGSASASEIVSGALQDYERATILGENTYGKGSVQDIFPIGKGDAYFKCTTQYYQLPKGRIIHRKDDSKQWGIQPDLEVKMTNKEVIDWLEARRDADVLIAKEDRDPDNPQIDPRDSFNEGLDPQLEAAVLLLKARQVASKTELAKNGE